MRQGSKETKVVTLLRYYHLLTGNLEWLLVFVSL
jgi:hypothetical protein